MALIDKKILNPIRYHQDNANTVIGQASTMKALFDQGAEDLRVKLNGVIDELLATTGAQQIGIDPARGLGNTLADALTNIKNYMNLGASSISAEVIGTGSGDNVQAQLLWLMNQIKTMVLGQIPEGTISIDKLTIELANLINGHTTQLAQKPSMTTAPITLYVSTTGNDSNDGLTTGTALRNIQTAINKIPQILRHPATINLAAGTYNEDIEIAGFYGKGILKINGGSDLISSANYVLNGVLVNSCACRVDIVGIRATTTVGVGIFAALSTHIRINNCSVVSSSSSAGIQMNTGSMAIISNCLISNRLEGIKTDGALISSINNSGTANGSGLFAALGGVIAKNGTQPSGTVSEGTNSGGVIR